MPSISIEIPNSRYPEFLRLVANFLEGVPAPLEDSRSAVPSEASWQVDGDELGDGDLDRLAALYRELSPTAKRLLDHLLAAGAGATRDELAVHLGLQTKYALAGTVGHIAKQAARHDRVSVLAFDKATDRYSIVDELREALTQARLWSVGPPFTHRFVIDGTDAEVERVLDRPHRFASVSPDGDVSFHATRDDLLATDPHIIEHGVDMLVEFAPAHESQELVDATWLRAAAPGGDV